MRYATLPDLQLAIPTQTLIQLSNDDSAATVIDEAVVGDAVRQAEELVDAHLRGRYTLPLSPVPTVIKDLVVHLARHGLYARRPEGADLPDAVVRTYKAAMELLREIRNGVVTIGDPATGAAQAERGEARVRARRRTFGQDVMDRY